MRTSESIRTGQNATSDDCARLWRTLTTDYIPDLRIETTFLFGEEAPFGIMIELVSPGLDPEDGEPCINIWSMRSFWNPLHLISWGGLFDLLIVGYRAIDEYFRIGDTVAPPRRRA
jgi:hypothetical protein